MSDSAGENLVLVGEITAPFGVRGEVKMRPLMDDPRKLTRKKSVLLRYPDGREENRRITSARMHQEAALIQLEGITDRNGVELLRGVGVYLPEKDLPPLPPGEYYQHQLLGLQVVTDAGRDLGRIETVHFYPANDVYETPVALIPGVEGEFIVSVNLEVGQMVVRDVPGLEKES
jgi:16S rRNA processing protein RimM